MRKPSVFSPHSRAEVRKPSVFTPPAHTTRTPTNSMHPAPGPSASTHADRANPTFRPGIPTAMSTPGTVTAVNPRSVAATSIESGSTVSSRTTSAASPLPRSIRHAPVERSTQSRTETGFVPGSSISSHDASTTPTAVAPASTAPRRVVACPRVTA